MRRAAVATQAFVNPLWGTEGRGRLEPGEAAEALLAEFATALPSPEPQSSTVA